MNLRTFCCLCYALILPVLDARSVTGLCGTYPESWRESLDHHLKVQRRLAESPNKSVRSSSLPRRDADIGNIAVIESDDSIFGRRNPFNLDSFQVNFTPSGAKYTYQTTSGGFDQVAAGSGDAVRGLADDDTRRVALPFAFPFYGNSYRELWLNSDGNVSFTAGDKDSTERSVGRMAAGPPRISALYTDLDPTASSGSIRITSSPTAYTITWFRVPEYSDFGSGRPQTFQIKLFPNGNITLAWEGINIKDGVVGISPGDVPTRPFLASFRQNTTGTSDSMIAERFGDAQALDLVSAARRFYETHDDSYDYLAFFNSTGVQPGTGVLAFETSVRTNRRGIGDTPVDVGREFGSPNRLQAVLNMGPVANFPSDPNTRHPLRFSTGDTGITVFAHEIGHLFLAYVSVRDPFSASARPMLGRQLFHWNFRFNSEASLLEGNRIRDDGPNADPRFTTTATVEGFSPLDQYLMGLRAPEEVPTTFLVERATTSLTNPQVGVSFNGSRRDVSVDDLISVEGRRVPDHTIEQRRYRIAMILITPEGQSANAQDIALLERYRSELETAFPRYVGNRALIETSLRSAIRLSIEPAAGVLNGSSAAIEVRIQQPAAAPLTVGLTPVNGFAAGPASVTIPAGARSATATFRALRSGVETILAEPLGNSAYMTTEARLNIAEAARALQLRVVAGDRQLATPGQLLPEPVVVKLTDANDLAYANVRIVASGGAVTPPSAVTGADGRATFRWTPNSDPLNAIRFAVEGSPLPTAEAVALGRPLFSAGAVVNAASYKPGICPGSIATIFGANLAQSQVTVAGEQAEIYFANDRQINFLVPDLIETTGVATVQVRTALGNVSVPVPLFAVQPGIFFDTATGRAAAINRGSRSYELYGTGFGDAEVTARVGGREAEVEYSGSAPLFFGLYQVNIRVDNAVPSGDQPVVLTADGIKSNEVKLTVTP